MFGPEYYSKKTAEYLSSARRPSEEVRQRMAGWAMKRDLPRRPVRHRFRQYAVRPVENKNQRDHVARILRHRRQIARSSAGTPALYARAFLSGYKNALTEMRRRNAKSQPRDWKGRFS